MNNLFINLVIVAAILAACCATKPPPVQQCHKQNFDDLENRITINPCGSKKCKLPLNRNVTVEFRFNPQETVISLVNDVYAVIGINFPFIGTTGESACGNIIFADSKKHAACPLEANKEYIYKNTFFIYPYYPKVDLLVHWSLNDGDRQVICFEVPAAIVEKPK